MRIGFWHSDKGGSPLVDGLRRGLSQLGHMVHGYKNGEGFDLVLMFNQCAHTVHYTYPEFPDEPNHLVFVDSAEYGYFKRLPEVAPQYANAFSEGSINHDTKNREEQLRLRDYMQGRSFPYFLREYFKFLQFPISYHPIDYPAYVHSICPHIPVRDEYLNRKLDLFMYWGGSHPWRIPITQALRDCHTTCEITVIGENGAPRMNQGEYFNRTRRAKCSVSFDGYGSSSFRLTEVLMRCLLLKGPLSIVRQADLTDGVNCVEYSIETDGENFISTNACAKLRECLDDPERSFRIYEAGYYHCMEHYTEQATAKYLMQVVEQHDWSHPTPIMI